MRPLRWGGWRGEGGDLGAGGGAEVETGEQDAGEGVERRRRAPHAPQQPQPHLRRERFGGDTAGDGAVFAKLFARRILSAGGRCRAPPLRAARRGRGMEGERERRYAVDGKRSPRQ